MKLYIETRVEVWEKREIGWEHEREVRVFPRNFEFLPSSHKCFYNSKGTGEKKINLLISITCIQIFNYILYVRLKNNKTPAQVFTLA